MTEYDGEHGARHVRLADLPKAEIGDHIWHPVRRALGATGFGVGAYSAARAGDVLVGDARRDRARLEPPRGAVRRPARAGAVRDRRQGARARPGGVPPRRSRDEPWCASAGRRDERPRHRRRAGRRRSGAVRALVHGADGRRPARGRGDRSRGARAVPGPRPAQLPARLLPGARGRARRGGAAPPPCGRLGRACMDVARGRLRSRRAACGARRRADEGAGRPDPRRASRDGRVGRAHPRRRSRIGGCGTASGSNGRRPSTSFVSTSAASASRSLRRARSRRRATSSPFSTTSGSSARSSSGRRTGAASPSTWLRHIRIGSSGLVLAGAGLPDHQWSAEIEAFGAAEDEALEAGDLDRATEVNIDFWLPSASEAVREAVRVQQRRAFELGRRRRGRRSAPHRRPGEPTPGRSTSRRSSSLVRTTTPTSRRSPTTSPRRSRTPGARRSRARATSRASSSPRPSTPSCCRSWPRVS